MTRSSKREQGVNHSWHDLTSYFKTLETFKTSFDKMVIK